jgi:hypothetical protein
MIVVKADDDVVIFQRTMHTFNEDKLHDRSCTTTLVKYMILFVCIFLYF